MPDCLSTNAQSEMERQYRNNDTEENFGGFKRLGKWLVDTMAEQVHWDGGTDGWRTKMPRPIYIPLERFCVRP